MSGPPPCTTTGFSPTYLSSTTSVAKASRSSSSRIAAPPYLITTVRPWNSRMYGSASRRVSTELLAAASPASRPPEAGSGLLMVSRSCGVSRIQLHVVVGQVGAVDVGGSLAAAEPADE